MRKSQSLMIRLVSWCLCLCMLVTTTPMPAHALAPKSLFEKGPQDPLRFVKALMSKAIGEVDAKDIPRIGGMDVLKKITGKKDFRYLIVRGISKSDLPDGYPTALREPNPSKPLPGEIIDTRKSNGYPL